jgi:hypothetical protein
MRPDKEKELFRVTFEDLKFALEIGRCENPTSAELRRASDVLRRLLLPGRGDNLLKKAAKRLHHSLTYMSSDYKIAERLISDRHLVFFQRGGAALWGIEYEGLVGGPSAALQGLDLHSGRTIELTHEAFLSEIVLGFHGSLISLKSVIEYVAHKTGGVHLSFHRERDYAVLDQIRQVVLLRPHSSGSGMVIELHRDRYLKPSDMFTVSADRIDVSLSEILSVCRIMTRSRSVCELGDKLRSVSA